MRSASKILVLATVAVFIPMFCSAVEITEEEVTPRSKRIYLDEESEKTFIQKGKIKNIVGVSEGYDNNTHLDSRRDGDAYTQLFYKGTFTSSFDDKLQGILEYSLMSLLYADESNLNIVNNEVHLAFDRKLNKDTNFIAGYYIDLLEYTNTGNDDYYENRVELKLKQNLPHKFFHGVGYEAGFKNYQQRHTRVDAATYSENKRSDFRNTGEYEIGKYFTNDMVKLYYEYYLNNSNERYLNYYDYDSDKVGLSLTHLFNEKFFGYLAFSRQYRSFRSRTLTLDADSKEWDRTYLATSSLYYNFNRSLTFGISYSYRQNWSNEALENYSGSLISLASYYRF